MFQGDMDPECIELCKAMNLVPGIETSESCCGHGHWPYRIWFWADDLECLPNLLYWFDGCHCGSYDWNVIVRTDCGKSPVTFRVEGPKGEEAHVQSVEIAALITEDMENLQWERERSRQL